MDQYGVKCKHYTLGHFLGTHITQYFDLGAIMLQQQLCTYETDCKTDDKSQLYVSKEYLLSECISRETLQG